MVFDAVREYGFVFDNQDTNFVTLSVN